MVFVRGRRVGGRRSHDSVGVHMFSAGFFIIISCWHSRRTLIYFSIVACCIRRNCTRVPMFEGASRVLKNIKCQHPIPSRRLHDLACLMSSATALPMRSATRFCEHHGPHTAVNVQRRGKQVAKAHSPPQNGNFPDCQKFAHAS